MVHHVSSVRRMQDLRTHRAPEKIRLGGTYRNHGEALDFHVAGNEVVRVTARARRPWWTPGSYNLIQPCAKLCVLDQWAGC